MSTEDGFLFPEASEAEPWRDHWKDMPEFVQPDLMPWKQLTVNFASRADMEAFVHMVGQKVTFETKSIWFPEVDSDPPSNWRWSDEP